MELKVYTSGTRSMMGSPYISLRSNGNVYINSYAMNRFFKGIKYVLMLYSEKDKIVGIRPLKNKEDKCYSLNFSSKNNPSTGVIAARGFLALLLGKDNKKSYKIKAEWNEKEHCLIAKI